ncbi:MAG: hypothetical protein KAS32_13810 [Candidatus Peribacteraceae bacterium]|nr:hypothetical protein [Candidatus Peribacteraceae bacterium]
MNKVSNNISNKKSNNVLNKTFSLEAMLKPSEDARQAMIDFGITPPDAIKFIKYEIKNMRPISMTMEGEQGKGYTVNIELMQIQPTAWWRLKQWLRRRLNR